MPSEKHEQQIYLVISQTGTILSRVLKLITGAEYNHASVSLEPSLRRMYSFGRLNPYNPFFGGFVVESPRAGTFGRFSNTKAVVLSLRVDDDTYEKIDSFLKSMYERRRDYHYNYLGLVLAAFRLPYRQRNCYYCSEFVREILTRFSIVGDGEFDPIVKPIHFLRLSDAREIFRGRLRRYRAI